MKSRWSGRNLGRSDRECGHHIVAALIGPFLSAQPKVSDTRQFLSYYLILDIITCYSLHDETTLVLFDHQFV